MTRKRAQQTGPSLFDELDEQGATQGGGVFRAPEPQRRARAEKPAPPPVVAPDEVSEILARARAEHERLDRAITAARHRAERPEETTDHA